jgi:hypothetical protein
MSDEMDPEVIADLKLRAYSERDSSRGKVTEDHIANWRPDGVVTQWKCRMEKCMRFMDVTQEGIDRLDDANAHLAKRGEPPLKSFEVAICQTCMRMRAGDVGRRLRERVTGLAENIRKLKEHAKPRQASELLAAIIKAKHPDLPGLLDAIEARRSKSGESGKRERKHGL